MLYPSNRKNVIAVSVWPLHVIVVSILLFFWWEILLACLHYFFIFQLGVQRGVSLKNKCFFFPLRVFGFGVFYLGFFWVVSFFVCLFGFDFFVCVWLIFCLFGFGVFYFVGIFCGWAFAFGFIFSGGDQLLHVLVTSCNMRKSRYSSYLSYS